MKFYKILECSIVQAKKNLLEIYGLGYVGLPLAVRLASAGFNVIGIDKDLKKVERLQSGKLLDSEKFLKNNFEMTKKSGNLTISETSKDSRNPKIGIICVPTPIPQENITSDKFVMQSTETFLENAKKGDIIILESSIEVGTTDTIQGIIESKGFKVGQNFGLAFCPERIDPKNKKWSLENIPRIIYCSDDQTYSVCKEVYNHINNANLNRVSSAKIAEVVKSFENTFRLVNISLVNELAILCDKLEIDVKEIIDAAATKPFGFMPFYPSAGAGGHCIPKDPRLLLESAKKFGIQMSTLQNALSVNTDIPKYIVNQIIMVLEKNNFTKSVLVCGLAYKPDIEDMRDSAGFKVLTELSKNGVKVSIYDPYYNEGLEEKYRIENHIDNSVKFYVLTKLDAMKNFGCMCIVQHHTSVKYDIERIYKNEQVPFIYDCQNELKTISKSRTILKKFGA